jgi:hypothetical protein
MSLLTVIARGIYWSLGAVQAAGELVGAGKKLVRAARRGTLPHELDQTDPIPLAHPSKLPPPPKKPRLVTKGPIKLR